MDLTMMAPERVQAFTQRFADLFPDRRLFQRFEEMTCGMLASSSTRVSEMVAALPHRLQRQFHHAKALYRFLDNDRVKAEVLLERVCQESASEKLSLVVSHVPALKKRGRWWLLTNLAVEGAKQAQGVVELYRKRWRIEELFRLLKTGLGLEEFQVESLARIRKVIAILLGLAVFLWEVRREGGPFKTFLLQLGGKLGLKSERDGPYLLLRGLIRLLNQEVTLEELERARQ